ncbi:MAG: nuclear transport factor 2 family protein [Bacteroidales bacterium]|nr:nuclear transport factor 2 family protein [Candidatus Latescibacterota bacterium]
MKNLKHEEMIEFMDRWMKAWDDHDLEKVLDGFAKDVVFEGWTGRRLKGKDSIRDAWSAWFEGHGGFRFIPEEVFVDEKQQKVLWSWRYEGPSFSSGSAGELEIRNGVDVLVFEDGLIKIKQTYSKTMIEIGGRKVVLKPTV